MKRSSPLRPKLLLALLAVLLPAVAFADARIEARRHFRKGMTLIAEGSFDAGVAELMEAYAIKPHPNVLYNVARAYHDAGRVSEALEYYRRYLAANPPDDTQVRATVSRLEESLAANAKESAKKEDKRTDLPMPPAPSGTGRNDVRSASFSTPTSPAAGLDRDALERFNALMQRLESAVAKAESASSGASTALPASGGRVVGSAVTPDVSVIEQAEENGEGAPYEEQVVTASRRAQSTLEAPNATTIITGEEIRLSGATTIVELLRRVPGAEVMTMGVGSANVSLRGFNQRLANKVLVLLDGRTEYQDFLGLTVWSAIPVGVDEIDRIEVIRGPGSALYGANAMLGIINIITRNPGTGPSASFNVGGATGNGLRGSFVASGGKNLRYRASVGYEQGDKWSRDFDDNRSDIRPNVENTALGLRSGRANFSAVYNFNPELQVGVSGGVNRLYTEFYPIGALRNFYFDGLTSYAKADLGAGPLKLKLFWNHLDTNSGPEYGAVGELTTTRARVSSNVFDAELSFSRDFELLGQHQLGLGVEGRLKQVDWNFIGGTRSEPHAAVYIQDEWRIVNPFRVVASYRVDRHPLLDYLQSPRVSAVWIPAEGQALRAGVATAFRAPTFLESYTSVRFPIPGVPGASALTQGNQDLKPESLTAYELGYRGDLPILGLEYDLALYQNRVENLIRLSGVRRDVDFYDPETGTYLLGRSVFENESENIYTARGAELGTKISPLDGLDIRVSGAFQSVSANDRETGDAIAREACGVCTQAPSWKAFAGVSYRSPANIDISVDAAYNDKTIWVEREPGGAADPTSIREQRYELPAYAVFNARLAYRFFQDRATVAVQGTHLGVAHSEHPFGNKITQRFFVTLSVTP